MNTPYYITTTLPYVNADPHIGFALEIVQADALARLYRLRGFEVIFNTGTDEHGLKIYRNATEQGLDPKAYADMYAKKFDGLKEALGLTYTNFIRTTDTHHIAAAQEFWRRCAAAGDIYKKNYSVRYCVGCELEKTDSELESGRCPIHPNKELETIEEENYFFRWSKYAEKLLELYASRPDFVIPESRANEIKSFVASGLQDFSISRLKAKMPWGISVPGDEEHVMYVWFDALVNYISTLGWPEKKEHFERFWPGVQVAGKDNLRQQSAMWQAMLLSAGLPASKQIFIHGFISSDGQKMSKSLGNVVSPYDLVEEYGTDAVRLFLLGGIPSYQDGDYTQRAFAEYYNAKLVNGVGNLLARTLTMIEKYADGAIPERAEDIFDLPSFWKNYTHAFEQYKFDEAVHLVDQLVTRCNQAIDEAAPWKAVKEGKDVRPFLYQLTETLRHIALAELPFIPHAAEKMLACFSMDVQSLSFDTATVWGGLLSGTVVKKGAILFPRKAL